MFSSTIRSSTLKSISGSLAKTLMTIKTRNATERGEEAMHLPAPRQALLNFGVLLVRDGGRL